MGGCAEQGNWTLDTFFGIRERTSTEQLMAVAVLGMVVVTFLGRSTAFIDGCLWFLVLVFVLGLCMAFL